MRKIYGFSWCSLGGGGRGEERREETERETDKETKSGKK